MGYQLSLLVCAIQAHRSDKHVFIILYLCAGGRGGESYPLRHVVDGGSTVKESHPSDVAPEWVWSLWCGPPGSTWLLRGNVLTSRENSPFLVLSKHSHMLSWPMGQGGCVLSCVEYVLPLTTSQFCWPPIGHCNQLVRHI